jgi:hypothetical protein
MEFAPHGFPAQGFPPVDTQTKPSPEKPDLHVQAGPPSGASAQVAFGSHGSGEHGLPLLAMQVVPFPT